MSRNVPKLRFKDFDDEWKEKSFKDIFNGFEYGMNSAAVIGIALVISLAGAIMFRKKKAN